jgi:homoaconitase/3-isopropylmalate dehydratase large subunit
LQRHRLNRAAAVFATGKIWFKVPTVKIDVKATSKNVAPKDLILAIIEKPVSTGNIQSQNLLSNNKNMSIAVE